MLGREAVLHTPITESFGPRSCPLGTCNAIVLTLKPAEGVVAGLREVRPVEQVEHAEVEEERVVGLPDPALDVALGAP